MKLSDNRAFQILVGSGVCYLLFRLWSEGWFSVLFAEGSEGFSNPAIVPMLVAAVAGALQLIGIIAIGIASGVLSLFAPLLNSAIGAANQIKDKVARKRLPEGVADKVDAADVPSIDPQKLTDVLNDMSKRISDLEIAGAAAKVIESFVSENKEVKE